MHRQQRKPVSFGEKNDFPTFKTVVYSCVFPAEPRYVKEFGRIEEIMSTERPFCP